MPPTVCPKGTTIYDPKKCFNGYTALPFPIDGKPGALLIDMNGERVHQWVLDSGDLRGGVPRARLLPDGHMLVLRQGRKGDRYGGGQEYDWDGKLVWEYEPPEGWEPHHDIFRKANGNTLLVCREMTPEAYRRKAKDPARRERDRKSVV